MKRTRKSILIFLCAVLAVVTVVFLIYRWNEQVKGSNSRPVIECPAYPLRVSVDAGDYRLKREEALQQLAKKMAAKAAKYHRNFTLEPMNAYERHVIHAALQDYPDVTTFSTGSEPHRRIVVAYSKDA